MQKLLFLLLLAPCFAAAQSAEYTRFMKAGERELRAGHYDLAGKKFTAALEFAFSQAEQKAAREAVKNAERRRVQEVENALRKAETVIGHFGFRQDRAWAYKDGKFAVIDRSGQRLTDFVFSDPQPFEASGLALAQKDGFYHLVDKQGGLSEAYNYFFPTNNGWYKVRKGNLCTFLDRQGRHIKDWGWYDKIENFSGGLAQVKKDGKWGFVDTSGQIIVIPQFDWVWSFSEGFAMVQKDRKWGLIDISGQIVVTPQFDAVWDFSKGFALVYKDGKLGFVDTSGQIVVAPQFDDVKDFFQGLAPIKKDGKWGFVDTSGQIVIAPQFEEVRGSFKNGTATVTRFGEWFPINKKGEMVVVEEIPPVPGGGKERK